MPGAGPVVPGYYKWLKDPISEREWDDAHLINAAFDIHADDPGYGYRFIADDLAQAGIVASENRVAACSAQRIFSLHSRKRGRSRKPGPPVHDDLLAVVDERGRPSHDFTAIRPDETWLTDISEHPTGEGRLYLCAVKDCYSHTIVGYSIDSRMTCVASSAEQGTGRRGVDSRRRHCRGRRCAVVQLPPCG